MRNFRDRSIAFVYVRCKPCFKFPIFSQPPAPRLSTTRISHVTRTESHRADGPAPTEDEVRAALRNVVDPELGADIVELGMVTRIRVEGADVDVEVALTIAGCPLRAQIQQDVDFHVGALPGVASVNVTTGVMNAMQKQAVMARARLNAREDPPATDIPDSARVVAIASGKGGVGKSTVSANIACALAQMGAKVGLMDADIYGPSIPIIMGVEDKQPLVDQKKEKMLPIEQYGVKIISMGFLQPGGSAVIWRGPMVAKAVQQFLREVEWGEIDYLIVDLPPGTGDAQLTLAQAIPLSGAVVVMTPQDLAAAVAVKAVSMFRRLDVPILGIVENMSYFLCPTCNSRHHVFSHGGGQQAAEALDVPFFGGIPLALEIGAEADEGTPSVVANPNGPYAQVFREVAERVAQAVSIRARTFVPLAMTK